MKRRPIVMLAMAFISLLALLMAGCSKDTIIHTNSQDQNSEMLSEIAKMFPATPGFQTTFIVTQSNGVTEVVTYTVGDEVAFGYATAHEMNIRSSSGERKTTYFVFSDSALYFYENSNATPEKVLSLPFTAGSSWDLSDELPGTFTDSDPVDADTTSNGIKGDDDAEEPKPGDEGNGGAAGKAFPGSSSGTFTIEQIETLLLSNGSNMSGTVLVRNDAPSATNYYWFTPGIGLIRYVLDADPNDKYDGTEVGELINYGIVQ